MGRFTQGVLACFLMIALTSLLACGALFHPESGKILEEAKKGTGDDGVKTLINLTTMMETTLSNVRDAPKPQDRLDRLHDEFHAINKAFCSVPSSQATHPSFVQASTIKKEMRTVFHQLWKYRDRPSLRDPHLDLFSKRIKELREALQAITN